ncbi:MAG: 16S rRNA (cytosine(1402)-N(4))-methyltransferase [Citromicrobium sp.]|nr:16S rRNA (cytosine(1402)-N(4))-methyltransferase [Citromicrobium sp.]MAO97024.1 16S rRNA (cytosine(1402)-N(4))-methyltransferase [Citromicrobium sp.]MBD75857.1 16S rRNA (cytosine(1402)-N(4))-methyltransferase [Citromicrobium sp.]
MSASAQSPHVPVLLDEVIAALKPAPGELIVDGTFGAGGYTRALLGAGATVHAFDRDPTAIEAAQDWSELAESPPRLIFHRRPFAEMADALGEQGVAQVDGVVLDIGVSSMQLDQAERGFSFAADGPLDMRMDPDLPSAADFLNSADEGEIADVIYEYGEERQSRRIARAIVAARPLETTGQLARLVRKATGHKPHDKKDPATRTFQAIRIHVNGELDQLRHALVAAEQLLAPGGRLVVVSFHSLEDRIVKRFLRNASGQVGGGSRHLPLKEVPPTTFDKPSRAVRAGEAELLRNPRARSAILRAATRTQQPAREEWIDG